jgi:hypothetical protein
LELLGRKSSGSGLKSENTAIGIRHADHWQLLSAKVDTNGGGRSVGILRSRTQDMEFILSMTSVLSNTKTSCCAVDQNAIQQRRESSRWGSSGSTMYTLRQWYSASFIRVLPDVISLQLFTLKVVCV